MSMIDGTETLMEMAMGTFRFLLLTPLRTNRKWMTLVFRIHGSLRTMRAKCGGTRI